MRYELKIDLKRVEESDAIIKGIEFHNVKIFSIRKLRIHCLGSRFDKKR